MAQLPKPEPAELLGPDELPALDLNNHLEVRRLFQMAVDRGASDLHLTAGLPPVLRIHGALVKTDLATLTPETTKQLIYGLLSDRQKAQFERELELDLSLGIREMGRFRINVHVQRGSVEAAFRLIPPKIRSFEDLGLPPVVVDLSRKPNGLVLVTGPTGVGKTTTLAAIVDFINTERTELIITIEDPIEYLHHNKRSIVKQREVYSDTKSFASALTRVLRQDPNIIVVGEMRDLETIATALTAAETGHLVLATLHTPDAPQTIDRILDVFPPYQQEQVKIQLADCLQGIVCQELLPRADGKGRVLACEVMVATSAVRNLIREHATDQLPTVLQTGAQWGMRTMDASIKELVQRQIITLEVALSHIRHQEELHALVHPGAARGTSLLRKH